MPRKTRIYWITAPKDLNKCHSRRCEDQAVKDRLCSKHWAAWQLAGFQPPMPVTYGGGVVNDEPPLKRELNQEGSVIDTAMNVIASMATDEVATLTQLEEVVRDLENEKAMLQGKKAKELDPYRKAYERTKRWFQPVEEKLDRAIELAKQRREVTRSTIQDLAPGGRRKKKKVS